MGRDIHKSPFDEGTMTKLAVLRQYIRGWFPVFFKDQIHNWQKVEIYDFFAGEGSDTDGNSGSPIIFLEELSVYCRTIIERNLIVELLFNEYNKTKYLKLKKALDEYIINCRKSAICPYKDNADCPFSIKTKQRDFKELFNELYPSMLETTKTPRFMFLDQNGIKSVDRGIFSKLISLERTDFLFFIASSFANRFAELPEFQEYLTINRQDFQFTEPYHCHRVILNYYKNLIPSNKKYYLAPFSIKKPFTGNIYGLIFGSNHLRGLEKFLDTAWALDKNTGEANYNIDNDDIIKTGQFSLFQESNIVKKLVLFQSLITEFIKIEPRTNVEIYQFTLESGFMPYHTREILIELQNADHIKVDMVDGKEKVRKSSFYLKYNPEKLIRISHE